MARADDAWIPLAEVARPHGVRGELRLKVYNADSDVLLGQDVVLVRYPDGEEHEVTVECARRADRAVLMKLYSVDDRDRADELRGAHICVRRRDFPPLEEGEFYACDIEGAEVSIAGENCEGDRPFGVVREVITYPSLDVLLVEVGTKRYEVPLVEAMVRKVDTDKRRVVLIPGPHLEE